MTTLITGATGFVGSAVLRKLLNAGHTVRTLVRPKSDHRNLEGLDIEIISGDLNDLASLERAVKGCRYLFHVAADYRLWVPAPKQIYTTNVEGTRNLMRAAAEAGVERIESAHKLRIPESGPKKNQTGTDDVVDGDVPTTIPIQLVGLLDYFLTNLRFFGRTYP